MGSRGRRRGAGRLRGYSHRRANLGAGAVHIAPSEVVAILAAKVGIRWDAGYTAGQEAVLVDIRAPRVLLCGLVGAALAVAGAGLQGVFRNPLADPGIIGVSSGAAVGAVAAIVTGLAPLGGATSAVAAFAGGLAAAAVGYLTARHGGRTEVVTLVLTGVAVSAIAGAVVGARGITVPAGRHRGGTGLCQGAQRARLGRAGSGSPRLPSGTGPAGGDRPGGTRYRCIGCPVRHHRVRRSRRTGSPLWTSRYAGRSCSHCWRPT